METKCFQCEILSETRVFEVFQSAYFDLNFGPFPIIYV